MLEKLTEEQKAVVLTEFIEKIEKTRTIYGYCQILELLEDIAIKHHFIRCPRCKN